MSNSAHYINHYREDNMNNLEIDKDSILCMQLPFPPTVNHYWGHRAYKGRVITFLGQKGKDFRKEVVHLTQPFSVHALKYFHDNAILGIKIKVCPKDRRKRDLDNLNKALLDSLTAASIYEDDSQIDYLSMERERGVVYDEHHIVITLFRFKEKEHE